MRFYMISPTRLWENNWHLQNKKEYIVSYCLCRRSFHLFLNFVSFCCGLQEAIAEVPQMAWTQQGFHSTNPKALTKIHGSFLAEIIYHLKTWFRNNGE